MEQKLPLRIASSHPNVVHKVNIHIDFQFFDLRPNAIYILHVWLRVAPERDNAAEDLPAHGHQRLCVSEELSSYLRIPCLWPNKVRHSAANDRSCGRP